MHRRKKHMKTLPVLSTFLGITTPMTSHNRQYDNPINSNTCTATLKAAPTEDNHYNDSFVLKSKKSNENPKQIHHFSNHWWRFAQNKKHSCMMETNYYGIVWKEGFLIYFTNDLFFYLLGQQVVSAGVEPKLPAIATVWLLPTKQLTNLPILDFSLSCQLLVTGPSWSAC